MPPKTDGAPNPVNRVLKVCMGFPRLDPGTGPNGKAVVDQRRGQRVED